MTPTPPPGSLAKVQRTDTLPCPFCGGQAMAEKVLRDGYAGEFESDPDAWAHFLFCRCCAAEGPWAKSEGLALSRWNMRVVP